MARKTCRVHEWSKGLNDSHTEMEVQSKAAEEIELVSRQRNTGGQARVGEGVAESRHKNADLRKKLNRKIMGVEKEVDWVKTMIDERMCRKMAG